jgi:hypothetical protein
VLAGKLNFSKRHRSSKLKPRRQISLVSWIRKHENSWLKARVAENMLIVRRLMGIEREVTSRTKRVGLCSPSLEKDGRAVSLGSTRVRGKENRQTEDKGERSCNPNQKGMEYAPSVN